MWTTINLSTHTDTDGHARTHTHTHIYIYIHIHTHTHIYIHTYTHTHTHTHRISSQKYNFKKPTHLTIPTSTLDIPFLPRKLTASVTVEDKHRQNKYEYVVQSGKQDARNICQDKFSRNLISRALLMLTQVINFSGLNVKGLTRSSKRRAVRWKAAGLAVLSPMSTA